MEDWPFGIRRKAVLRIDGQGDDIELELDEAGRLTVPWVPRDGRFVLRAGPVGVHGRWVEATGRGPGDHRARLVERIRCDGHVVLPDGAFGTWVGIEELDDLGVRVYTRDDGGFSFESLPPGPLTFRAYGRSGAKSLHGETRAPAGRSVTIRLEEAD